MPDRFIMFFRKTSDGDVAAGPPVQIGPFDEVEMSKTEADKDGFDGFRVTLEAKPPNSAADQQPSGPPHPGGPFGEGTKADVERAEKKAPAKKPAAKKSRKSRKSTARSG